MSFTLRSVKVPPNSISLDEARHRVFDFFRAACISILIIMDIYNLQDVVTLSHLRSVVAAETRKHASITNPKFSSVIDMLLFKAMEELNNITQHAKRRHHIIGQFVVGREGLMQDTCTKDQGASIFSKIFTRPIIFEHSTFHECALL